MKYTIDRDKESKERLFQIQLASAKATSIKDVLSVQELYHIVDGMIRFYTARQLSSTNLAEKSDQELSLLLDDIILTIASDVELHMGSQLKSTWEVYFDPIPDKPGSPPSHLNLYIHTNTKLVLIRSLENMRKGNKGRLTQPNHTLSAEPEES